MVLDFESIHYVVQHGQQKVKGKSVHKPFALPWMGCTTHSPNQVLDPDLLTQNSVH